MWNSKNVVRKTSVVYFSCKTRQSSVRTIGLHAFLIRSHFVSNLVLDSLELKQLLELQGES